MNLRLLRPLLILCALLLAAPSGIAQTWPLDPCLRGDDR